MKPLNPPAVTLIVTVLISLAFWVAVFTPAHADILTDVQSASRSVPGICGDKAYAAVHMLERAGVPERSLAYLILRGGYGRGAHVVVIVFDGPDATVLDSYYRGLTRYSDYPPGWVVNMMPASTPLADLRNPYGRLGR